ncbi:MULTISPECIES: bacteriocin immunity protein [Clostridium]|uniref:bacteriocin immunity protein n=1 Tax=Clostridium TaxID=1485 RepID=UPI0006A76C5B|nr:MULTISPECIES: bacteriocin immunity protein [Clostridium]MCQ2013252.1 bacteriocin immunity protein [Clostridium butyricum]MDB2139545.1 bacteriocin immunity protein [Clostridium butyricum]MDU1116211.1 bacteriocin immunity protein [Clostridium sp.]MDU4587209.1 bacteriocin immunity protein [Clostridium sp.]MDU7713929.1 bacteriocin immunity protein [Clostridium butyricum]
MSERLTREELINLVNKIIECEGSEEEIDEMIEVVKRNVPYPDISDLIYWSEDELTPEQIIDKALNYKPIQL